MKKLIRDFRFTLHSLRMDYLMRKFKITPKKGIKFILHEYKTKDGINYCLKDERGEILMNIESSAALGDRILIMTKSFNNKGFEVQFLEK